MSLSDSSLTPPTLDVRALARWNHRAPAQSPWLHEEVGRRMQERLQWIVKPPQTWMDWEPVRGGMQAHDLVQQRLPKSQAWLVHAQAHHAQAAKQRWQTSVWSRLAGAKAVQFQEPPFEVDMVWANMGLHWAVNPPALIRQWAEHLHAQGFVMFSCFGPDTLVQLRRLHANMGWPAPAQEFTDMHDLGDMLVAQGFAEPVMDMEHIRLQFATAERAQQELRELGRNLHPARFAGLRGRQWHVQWLQAVQGLANSEGAIELNFEIIYGHAFKAPPKMKVAQETAISLKDMRQALQKPVP
ncbi:biotin synthase [Lampropedia puyangensis]|uniref:Biotin synthase n=1 Tax=Lampropedia puyangensis TaxID=1330072 RepID=A0A4S8FAF2_9BURK|nr:methyltransferase domain-containing protein [Lampropedia puyangensis]THU04568.1 biotin synthase [Lampropedia puyangensis]